MIQKRLLVLCLLFLSVFAVVYLAADEGFFFVDIESATENLEMLNEEAKDLAQRIAVLEAENRAIEVSLSEMKRRLETMEKLYAQIKDKKSALEEIALHIMDVPLKAEVEEALSQNREIEGSLLVNVNELRLEIQDMEQKFRENNSIIAVLDNRIAVNNKSIENLTSAIDKSLSQSEALKSFLKELTKLEKEITPFLKDEGSTQPNPPQPAEEPRE